MHGIYRSRITCVIGFASRHLLGPELRMDPKRTIMECALRHNLENYSAASNLLNNERMREIMAKGETIYHFGFGQSPFPLMEFAVQSLVKHADKSAYLPVIGIPELREAICKFHKKYDDLSLDPANVIVGPGTKELIFLLMNVFEGDVIVISPSWTTYKPQVLLSQHVPRIISTSMADHWKITAASLQKFIEADNLSKTKLLILNNPDNPTGTSYSEAELLALSHVCRKNNIIILSDEIYARLKYDHKHASMAKVYPEGTILCTGLSKWASAGGWRVGYHIYPDSLSAIRGAVRSAASHTYTSVAAPIQYASNEVLRDEAGCWEYMQHTTRIMATVGEYCHSELESVGVKSIAPTAGYYLFPDFAVISDKLKQRGINTCEDMVNAIFAETAVSVMAGGPAFLRPIDELTVRLCYVNFDGTDSLKESRRIGLSTPLPDNFVQQHCTKVHEGIQALQIWVQKQMDS